jgi:parvulin-like peptidyl-prolyl isomerase
MTFRVQPVSRRNRLPPRHDDERQQRLVTLGFIAVVALAVLMVGGVLAAGYYAGHLAAVATVDGTAITRDQWNDQQKVDAYRYTLLEERIDSALSAGRLDQATAQQELQYVRQEIAAIPSNALQELIDRVLQEKLAAQLGITVSDAEVDAQLANDATTPEQRKVLAIFVTPGQRPAASAAASPAPSGNGSATGTASPAPNGSPAAATHSPAPTHSPTAATHSPAPTHSPAATHRPTGTASATTTHRPAGTPKPTPSGSPSATPAPSPSLAATTPAPGASPAAPGASPTGPSEAQRAAAWTSAQEALAALQAGRPFDQVARQYSTDASATDGGNYGYITASDPVDPAWIKALFALPLNGTTDVIAGADGTYRIGRVVQIVPAQTDPHFQQRIVQAGVSLAAYRDAVRGDLYRRKLEARILTEATSGNVDQVHAWEIEINEADATKGAAITGPEVHASQILYSPNGDPSKASSLPASDPSWAAAQQKAQATADKLRAIADPAQRAAAFAAIAKAESNDAASGAQGGDLGWFTRAAMVKELSDAVFDGTHTADEIIGPVRSQYGYHVILFVAERPAPTDRVKAIEQALAQPGADFATIAKANSDASDAPQGGDMGWIARFQLDPRVEDILFNLQVGQVSQPIERAGGIYIYRVSERAQRPVDATQNAALQSSAFAHWYQQQTSRASIWRAPNMPVPASHMPAPASNMPAPASSGP